MNGGTVDASYNVMRFCIDTHLTLREYKIQPARDMIRWRQMLAAEREGERLGQRIAEAQAKARQH